MMTPRVLLLLVTAVVYNNRRSSLLQRISRFHTICHTTKILPVRIKHVRIYKDRLYEM